MLEGIEDFSYDRELKELGLFSLAKRKLSRDMITLQTDLWVNIREGDELFRLKNITSTR